MDDSDEKKEKIRDFFGISKLEELEYMKYKYFEAMRKENQYVSGYLNEFNRHEHRNNVNHSILMTKRASIISELLVRYKK